MFRRIVVGTDGSDTAARAVAAAAQLAGALGAALHVVTAQRSARDAARSQVVLEGAAGAARAEGPEPVTHARRDGPAAALIAVAEDVEADLIVVGNRGMTGKARWLLGSVADAVAHRAPCSVLIVHTTTAHGGAPRPAT
jgi:nucleotide-binding universal stress UspA family protein